MCQGMQDPDLTAKGPGGIWFTRPHPQLPGPLRHTLNIRAPWCQLPLAGLEHSCGGLTRQAGLNLGSQEEGQEGTRGSKGRGVSRRPGIPWAVVMSLILTGPARGWLVNTIQKGPGAGWGNTAPGWDLNSDLWLLPSAPASWVKPGGYWAWLQRAG